ncbi:kinase-like domain-containing protein [Tuber borchii]|uniref:Kinase-like domain-containing protein n=1 Tax=Tuber borchii TaxID=42251 RepID=A0A2T6ZQV4_TUBBO|nr:kinase-like domain-containing protein [Tuber borchii]
MLERVWDRWAGRFVESQPLSPGYSDSSPTDSFSTPTLRPTHHLPHYYAPLSSYFYNYPEPSPLTTSDEGDSSPIGYPSPPPPTPPAPEPQAVGSHYTPVSQPPAWRLNYEIGTGGSGTVFLENVHIPGMKSPELWAVKRISRTLPNFTFKRYEAEINNLQTLARHEWFVKFNSTYKDTHYMYIAMEYMPMGDMSQSFADGYRWNESDTRVVIKQLLHGLAIMHKEGITHRDLKPENIFLYLPENQTYVLRVKIGDIGTSKRIPPSNCSTYLKTTTGTQGYMAPEVHDTSKPKTNRVDIWSLGCVLYRMCTGNLLFKDANEVFKYFWTASSSPLALDGIGFSSPYVSFLRDILQPIPEGRPSAEDCQKKAWIMSEVPGPEYAIGTDLHRRLSKINHQVPNVHSFRKMVANQVVDSSFVP